MNEVTIRKWPSLDYYYTVTLRDGSMGQMGCIDKRLLGDFYFHSYAPFDRANAYDRAQVMAAVNAEIERLTAIYKVTERLRS